MTAYDAAILADSPVLYVPLTDTSGTTAVALAGANGTYNGGPTFAVAGPRIGGLDTAVSLGGPGTSEYVNWPDHNNYSVGTTGFLSVEMWVKLAANDDWIATKGTTSTNYEWGTYTRSTGTIEVFVYNTVNGTSITAVSSADFLAPTGWVHVVFTLDRAAPALKLYVNGSLVDSASSASGTITPNGSSELAIGRRADDTGRTTSALSAAGFAIFGSILTATQVESHYYAGQTVWLKGGSNAAMRLG